MLEEAPLRSPDDYADRDVPSAVYASGLRQVYYQIRKASFMEDMSFRITDGESDLACCLLTAAAMDGTDRARLSNFGNPATFWYAGGLSPEVKTRVANKGKKILKERLSRYPGAEFAVADYFSHEQLNPLSMFALQDDAAVCSLSFSHAVPLEPSVEALHGAIRKRYRSFINNAQRQFVFFVSDADTFIPEHMEQLHACHVSASGRDVYPPGFWNAFAGLVRAGKGYIVLALLDGEAKGAALQAVSADRAYYAIGAFDRSLDASGLSHGCLWAAMEYARNKGYAVFETGLTHYAACTSNITEKEMNIGFFKRGFGGCNRPVMNITARITEK